MRRIVVVVWGLAALGTASSPSAAQNQVWIHQLGSTASDQPYAAAPGVARDFYIGGATDGDLGGPPAGSYDAWVSRCDEAGDVLWTRQFGTGAEDRTQALAPDGGGGVLAGGGTYGALGGPSAGGVDAWLARFDSQGQVAWMRQFGSDADESVNAAASDGLGGAFTVGYTVGALGAPNQGLADAWIARHDGAGNPLWLVQFGTPDQEAAQAAAADGAGGVYVGGWSRGNIGGPSGGDIDAWLARYDASGARVWIRQWGTFKSESVSAAAPDGSGGVFVGGAHYTSPYGFDRDVRLEHFDASGQLLWQRSLKSVDQESVHGLVADGESGFYVCGATSGDLVGQHVGSWDAWLARYDFAGNRTWGAQFGTFYADWTAGVAVPQAGRMYAVGLSSGALGGPPVGLSDVWIARYDSAVGVSLTCPPDFVEPWNGGVAAGQTHPSHTGTASYTDSCSQGVQLTYADIDVVANTPTNPLAPEVVITRRWTLTDGCGTNLSCDQRITLLSPGREGAMTLDLLPSQCPNVFASDGRSVTRAAAVGTWQHDAAQLDLGSLRLRRTDGAGRTLAVKPAWLALEDVTQPFYGPGAPCHVAGGEGFVDAVFEIPNVLLWRVLDLGRAPPGTSVELTLSGRLLDGREIEARDHLAVD